jgi:hypothetical protein
MPLFDDATLADEPVSPEAVTPEEQESVLAQIGALTGGTLSRVGDALSIPGDYFRGVIAGTPGERVTGRELNRAAGLAGPEDNWWNFAGGLLTDVATDPLSLLSGPAKALTPAGKAATKLAGPVGNLLDTAPTAMTRKAISEGWTAADLPMVAQRNRAALEATGRTASTLDPAVVGRPIWGTRTSRRAATLDDLIKYSDDPTATEQAARNLLQGDFDAVRGQNLAKSFGIGLPLGDPVIVGDFLGKGFGDRYADVLDTVGQGIRWSLPGRVAAAGFDSRVGGAIDAEEQITNIANFQNRAAGGAGATAEHTYQLAKLHEAHPEVFGDEVGNRALGRYLEGPAARTAADVAYVQSRPQLKAYADWWITNRSRMLNESKAAGLNAAPLQDAYGIEYLPRRAEAALEMESRRDRKLGDALSAFTTDALRRTDAMQLPGGRDTIIDLSRDPMIAGGKRLKTTDEDAAQYVMAKVNGMLKPGQPPIDIDKARHIARIMHTLPAAVTEKAPLFGQHPTQMIGSYMRNKGEALGTTKTLYDSLASFAADSPYNMVDGGRHISMQAALDRLGLKTYDNGLEGAAKQMRDRLAQLTGRNADTINLNEFSIPEAHIARLTKARDLYASGEVSSAFAKALDHYTQAWRGSILAWPARAVRDLYSGAISNWLEGALEPNALLAAKALIMEGPESPRFLSTLRSIPRYNTNDGLSQFYADLASTGLLSGGSLADASASMTGRLALNALPGSDPISLSSIGNELGQGWNRKDFFNWRSKLTPLAETTNPILRASERMNSLTDGINRLTGYLSLLKQGYEPMAAAAAMKRAHVDYSSLTSFEKNVLKQWAPWYSYQSRIFREVLRQLAERPGGRYGQLIQATEALQDEGDDGTYIPSDLRSQFAFPIPAEFGGVPAPGTQTYFKDLDFPGFDQINMIETPGTIGGTVQGTARQLAMQMHPLARQLVELATGEDLYTRQPLGSSTSALDSALRNITGNQNANVPAIIDKTVENLPFLGRPLGVVRSMSDTRGGQSLGHRAAKTALNALSGIKVQDVDAPRVLRDQINQIGEGVEPFTREFKQVYIPDHLKPSVPTWALRNLAVQRSLERDLRDLRKKLAGSGSASTKQRKRKRAAEQGDPMQLFE